MIEEVAHRVLFGFMLVFMRVFFKVILQGLVERHILVVLALLAGP